MKSLLHLIFISLISIISVIIYSCGSTNASPSNTRDQEIIIEVEGLHAEKVMTSVSQALKKQPGVKHVEVFNDHVKIVYEESKISSERLEQVIRGYGLPIKRAHSSDAIVTLAVSGMTCESCAGIIKTTLRGEHGVKNVVVSVEEKTVEVTFDPKLISKAQIITAINELGFVVNQ